MFRDDTQTKMLLPIISRQTRIASSSCTLIDNNFVNKLINFKSRNFTVDITVHFPIFQKYDKYFSTDKLPQKQIRYRLIKEATSNSFYLKLGIVDTSQIMIEIDIIEALVKIDNKIMECLNECCPVKTKTKNVSSRHQIKPWIN